jgi:uncharacterized protein
MVAGLVNIVIRFEKLVVAAVFCVLLTAGYGLTQIEFDDGYESVFASDAPAFQRYTEFKSNFADTSTNVAILVSSKTGFDKTSIDRLHDFVLDVHLVDGVEAGFSIFSLQRFDPVGGEIEPVFSDVSEKNISSLLDKAAQTSFSGLALVSPNGRKTAIIVSLADNYAQLQQAQQGLSDIQTIVEAFSNDTGMEAALSGLLPIRNKVVNQVRLDQPVINLLGALLGICVSLYIFRSFWTAVLNGIAPVLALIISLGFLGLLGFGVNVINTVLPVLVLVLASSDCTHITYEICRHSNENRNAREAIRNVMIEVAPACILTSITTALAFASLYISNSPIIRELSISGVVSVLAGLGTVLLIHPLVYVVATRFAPIRSALGTPLRVKNTLHERQVMFGWLLNNRLPVAACGALLSLVALWFSFPIQTSYQFSENINSNDELVRTLEELETFSGPMTSLEFPISLAGPQKPLSAEALREVGQIHEAIESIEEVFAVTSIHTLNRFFQSQGHTPSLEDLNDVLELLPEQYLHRIVSKGNDGYLLSVLVPDYGSNKLRDLAEHIREKINGHHLSAIRIQRPTGMLALSAEMSDTLIRQLVFSFLAAALTCPLLIGLWFRRLDFALLAVLPNMLPVLVVGAWLRISGNDIQFTSALALTIAFGIAIDDTIHVFNRLHLELRSRAGRMTLDIIIASMVRITPALVTTTLILSAGLITVLWSDMPMIGYFGLLCIATFALALLADIFLLPSLIALRVGVSSHNESQPA